jgi:hypothetical protein
LHTAAPVKLRVTIDKINTPQRLVARGGSWLNQTTFKADKNDGRAQLERHVLFCRRTPVELPLSDIAVTSVTDAASGAEIYLPVVRTRAGETLALPGTEHEEADEVAGHLRDLLGLH